MKKRHKDPTVHLVNVLRILSKKRNVLSISERESIVLWDRSHGTEGIVGNKTLGKLDFLKRVGFKIYKFKNHEDFLKETRKLYN